MAFVGPNTQFKQTLRSFRQGLFALGYNFIQVYNRVLTFKLRKHLYTFTITALSTATTEGSQYTSNGKVFTVQASAIVGATTILMSCENGLPNTPPSTLTHVSNSSGTLGTAQATIAYSSYITTPACLGPYEQLQEEVTVRSQL